MGSNNFYQDLVNATSVEKELKVLEEMLCNTKNIISFEHMPHFIGFSRCVNEGVDPFQASRTVRGDWFFRSFCVSQCLRRDSIGWLLPIIEAVFSHPTNSTLSVTIGHKRSTIPGTRSLKMENVFFLGSTNSLKALLCHCALYREVESRLSEVMRWLENSSLWDTIHFANVCDAFNDAFMAIRYKHFDTTPLKQVIESPVILQALKLMQNMPMDELISLKQTPRKTEALNPFSSRSLRIRAVLKPSPRRRGQEKKEKPKRTFCLKELVRLYLGSMNYSTLNEAPLTKLFLRCSLRLAALDGFFRDILIGSYSEVYARLPEIMSIVAVSGDLALLKHVRSRIAEVNGSLIQMIPFGYWKAKKQLQVPPCEDGFYFCPLFAAIIAAEPSVFWYFFNEAVEGMGATGRAAFVGTVKAYMATKEQDTFPKTQVDEIEAFLSALLNITEGKDDTTTSEIIDSV